MAALYIKVSIQRHSAISCSTEITTVISRKNLKDANHKIHEETGIKLDDVRDKNSIFTSKGCEPSHDITHLTKAREIKNLLDQKKIPITEKMYTCDMIRKSQHYICKYIGIL